MVGPADPLLLSTIFYFLVFNTKKKLLVDEILAYGIYIDEEWEEEERNLGYNKRMIQEIKLSYDCFCSRRQHKMCIFYAVTCLRPFIMKEAA